MHAVMIIASIALGLGAGGEQPAGQERMSAPPGSTVLGTGAEVAMDMSFGKPAVDVMINGRGPFKLLVDTGAAPTLILNDDLAEELGLEATGRSLVGDPSDSAAIEVGTMRVGTVGIGGAEFRGVEAIAWDRSTLYAGEGAPRGVLGFPLFRDVLVSFDYPAGVMRVTGGRLEAGAHTITYSSSGGVPSVPVTIGGGAYDAHLDSGSMDALTMPIEMSDKLALKSRPVEIARARTVNSEFAVLSADYDGELLIAGHTIAVEAVTFNEILPSPNIGSRVLKLFCVTFDQQNRLVAFERDGKGPIIVRKPRGGLGLQLGRRGEEYVVAGTVPGSPAAGVDLREGDVLVEVNGHAIAGLAPGDLGVEMRKPTVVLTIERGGDRRTVTIVRAGE